MVDIHSHVLPALDDGARTLADAVEMMRLAAAAGTTDIAATPHADLQFAFDPEVVDRKIAELRQASGGVPCLHRGCDFHLTAENVRQALEDPARYTLNGKRYLLIEFSEVLVPRSCGDIFDRLQAAGLILILTHPERNGMLQKRPEQVAAWIERGLLVQVTGQSLLGRFGRTAKRAASQLLERGLVHFIASDAHDPLHRPPMLDEAHAYVSRHFGPDLARTLFVTNPRAALEGEPIPPDSVAARRARKWYHF